ncbi:thioredoxin domain-containing protein [uncultured Amnibacterium sp.]|uniref:thioredoxin domain-containing protein n=1 Tax=uncultured Amnibacterium sp. TaxID=1631851 RepID=UPI0035CBCFB6
MAERLRDAVSPYLRSHAGNPVDWFPWGDAAFAAARERDVPVLVSIGYATCHWCHVMARESFSDPDLAARLNAGFVAIKVDREEHPEVDAACLAAAGAFTPNLGWPLNVFMTPQGRVFHAGTYSPPRPAAGHPSFRQVLDAVQEAWTARRADVEASAAGLAAALAAATEAEAEVDASPVTPEALARVVDEVAAAEDPQHGGFGGAPKFPVAPLLLTLLALGRSPLQSPERRRAARDVAERALVAMRDGGLRDPVEGGFFRYAVRRDWTEPHYERMLTDNALLLRAYAELGDRATAAGIVGFLREVLRRPSGAFGSAQDSESQVDGHGSEGGYYALDAADRAHQPPPAVDAKVLSGWNGLAIGALAHAGALLAEPSWVALAEEAADAVLAAHLHDGVLLRASLDGRPSDAVATLEDHGALADGLLEAALVAGRPDLAVAARSLVDACLRDGRLVAPAGDPVLAALGVPGGSDVNEGAVPSGPTAIASAAWRLHLLTGDAAYRDAAVATVGPLSGQALTRPIGTGAALGLAVALAEPVRQVVVVGPDPAGPLAAAARSLPSSITAVVDDAASAAFAAAGFELFEARTSIGDRPAAYVCRDFVCRLPVTEPAALRDGALV